MKERDGASGDLLPGRATPEGTQRFATRSGCRSDHFSCPDELHISSLSLGTRRGEVGGVDDLLHRAAVGECVAGGINAFNTALSDRMQTSERAIGTALRRAIAEGVVQRDEIIIVTKGGSLTPEPDRVHDYPSAQRDLYATYIEGEIVDRSEIESSHAFTPVFLRDQIARSRRNLGFATLDYYLIQEPEIHLRRLGPEQFRHHLALAFEALESEVSEGHIGAYGVCTWNGLLLPDSDRSHLSVVDLFDVALQVGSGDHHLRALQLPYGIAMGEGGVLPSQLGPDGLSRSVLNTLTRTGTAVFASAPLYGGRLVGRVPSWVRAAFPEAETHAQCALQFARSTRNISSAVVGMLDDDHVAENLRLGNIPRANPDLPEELFRAVQSAQSGNADAPR